MKISGFNKELRMRNIYSIYLHQQNLTIKLFQKRCANPLDERYLFINVDKSLE